MHQNKRPAGEVAGHIKNLPQAKIEALEEKWYQKKLPGTFGPEVNLLSPTTVLSSRAQRLYINREVQRAAASRRLTEQIETCQYTFLRARLSRIFSLCVPKYK